MNSWFDEAEDSVAEAWSKVCDWVAEKGGRPGRYLSDKLLRRITVGAPVVMGFTATCCAVYLLELVFPSLERLLGVHDSWAFYTRFPWQYTSLVTHVFAHRYVRM